MGAWTVAEEQGMTHGQAVSAGAAAPGVHAADWPLGLPDLDLGLFCLLRELEHVSLAYITKRKAEK